MKLYFGFSLIFLFSLKCFSQGTDTLKMKYFPCCISGMDWSEKDQELYLVSDLQNYIYTAHIDLKNLSAEVTDSFKIQNSPHQKGLEAIRKNGNIFYLAYEKDEVVSGKATATAFISKGTLNANIVTIEKSISIENLPNNKGIEGLTLSEDKNSIWVSHETMAKPRNGLDSVKFIRYDTTLLFQDYKWYNLPSQEFFKGNLNAYDDYGITEIVSLKDSLIVLERGYGKQGKIPELFINIHKAHINSLTKSFPMYTFKATPGRLNITDNYEGMCHLKEANKLLVISDDNNNLKMQRTILLLLNTK